MEFNIRPCVNRGGHFISADANRNLLRVSVFADAGQRLRLLHASARGEHPIE
jgi:hypothetical protein